MSAPGLAPLVGHEELRKRLREAVERGRMPQSLLFVGPAGVGKQRLALWAGSLLLCGEQGPPCGTCRSCRLARRLEHPDLHWHFPLPRPKGRVGRRLREGLSALRAEELERRRRTPLEPTPVEGPTGIYLAAVEEIRSQASRRPAMGRRIVFVVGEADRMVPQAASQEAANAFLKLLEEPPPSVFLLLTSSRPGALLPTIRSRTVAVRVPPLERADVERFLIEEANVDPEVAARAARRSGGAIGRALRIAGAADADERAAAARMLTAAFSRSPVEPLRVAAPLGAGGGRGAFTAQLEALAALLRDALACSLGREELALDPESVRPVLAGSHRPDPRSVARALERVEDARAAAAGNGNPQAIAATLLLDLQKHLAGS